MRLRIDGLKTAALHLQIVSAVTSAAHHVISTSIMEITKLNEKKKSIITMLSLTLLLKETSKKVPRLCCSKIQL